MQHWCKKLKLVVPFFSTAADHRSACYRELLFLNSLKLYLRNECYPDTFKHWMYTVVGSCSFEKIRLNFWSCAPSFKKITLVYCSGTVSSFYP